MARRHNRSDTRKPKIESLRWSGGTFTFNALSAGSAALTFITASTEEDTLLRMRGEILAYIDAASAPPKLVSVAVGAIKALGGQGTTVVVNPNADDESPWFLYERFTLGYEEMVTDVIDVPGLTVFRKEIDLKAMRIFRPNDEAQLAVANTTLNGASAVNVVVNIRGLFGQH